MSPRRAPAGSRTTGSRKPLSLLSIVVLILLIAASAWLRQMNSGGTPAITLDQIPEYAGEPYVILQDNQPNFVLEDLTLEPFERYSQLDGLGRCGVAYANICLDIMPTEPRGEIGQVKPTGWHTVKYDCVDGKYLYNRCHLIGYQLAGRTPTGRISSLGRGT